MGLQQHLDLNKKPQGWENPYVCLLNEPIIVKRCCFMKRGIMWYCRCFKPSRGASVAVVVVVVVAAVVVVVAAAVAVAAAAVVGCCYCCSCR